MSYETDERLKGYLDTNQLAREQLCRAILALDHRFADVVPRHPRGGPDGGRDLEAVFKSQYRAFGAVGFVNQACDTAGQRQQVKRKFQADLERGIECEPKPQCFVCLTNVNLSVSEKHELVKSGIDRGLSHCEVMDRERLRITLDSPDGFAARYQYLDLALSEAEQATFFAKWGDDIQDVISTRFATVESTLNRLLFLAEASDALSDLVMFLELDRTYSADEIAHFRAFCYMHLREPRFGLFAMVFGSADGPDRMNDPVDNGSRREPAGIAHGIGGIQWEQHVKPGERIDLFDDEGNPEWVRTGSSSSIGMTEVKSISLRFGHGDWVRFEPEISVRDLDEASFGFFLNESLARKLSAIHVFANGYKLMTIESSDLTVDYGSVDPELEVDFSPHELSDPWARVRPSRASMFQLSFADNTPLRLYASPEVKDSFVRRRTNDGS
jgi:hypothetical protein